MCYNFSRARSAFKEAQTISKWSKEKRLNFVLAQKRGNPILPEPKPLVEEPILSEILKKQIKVVLPKIQSPKSIWIGKLKTIKWLKYCEFLAISNILLQDSFFFF